MHTPKGLTATTAMLTVLNGIESGFNGLIASIEAKKKLVHGSTPHAVAKTSLTHLALGTKDVLGVQGIETISTEERTLINNKVDGLRKMFERASGKIWDTPAQSSDYNKMLAYFAQLGVIDIDKARDRQHGAGRVEPTSNFDRFQRVGTGD